MIASNGLEGTFSYVGSMEGCVFEAECRGASLRSFNRSLIEING